MPMKCLLPWSARSRIDVSVRYIPERNDIVFLDFEPTKGKEIGKYRPALALSGKECHRLD